MKSENIIKFIENIIGDISQYKIDELIIFFIPFILIAVILLTFTIIFIVRTFLKLIYNVEVHAKCVEMKRIGPDVNPYSVPVFEYFFEGATYRTHRNSVTSENPFEPGMEADIRISRRHPTKGFLVADRQRRLLNQERGKDLAKNKTFVLSTIFTFVFIIIMWLGMSYMIITQK